MKRQKIHAFMLIWLCVCVKLMALCVSRQTGRRFNNCTLRSAMDLSSMCGLSGNHKQLIAAHCVSGFNLTPLLISQHWLLSRHPICVCVCVCVWSVDMCAWKFVVLTFVWVHCVCVCVCVCEYVWWHERLQWVCRNSRKCVHVRTLACVCVCMDQILKGAALLVSPGANVIANDKASRRVC